mmetsp:Transcript_15095/g.37967  ORF Transcript_15095/g.37967 Transcript_15095/m.37967 type:complete len:95 (+) Transcript_15095:1479-1763(+)
MESYSALIRPLKRWYHNLTSANSKNSRRSKCHLDLAMGSTESNANLPTSSECTAINTNPLASECLQRELEFGLRNWNSGHELATCAHPMSGGGA